ncbi:MAG: hypothetical protein F7C07_07300 [Desulfurococcales archaeon]|nr:hypothetical protein [Desulfurococcales archaeon]
MPKRFNEKLRLFLEPVSGARPVGVIDERQLALLWKLLLAFYILELILNRLLFRVLIFIPPGPLLDLLNVLTSEVGLFSLNAVTILSAIILLLHFRAPAALIPLVMLFLDIVGLAKASWALLAVALVPLYLSARRFLESLLMVFLALTSLTQSPGVVVAATILWLIAPIPLLGKVSWRNLLVAAPFILVSLAMAYRNYYIAGQILSLGMGLMDPLLLPLAIVLYSLAGFPGPLALLITGPSIQLSSQVTVIAAAYMVEQRRVKR